MRYFLTETGLEPITLSDDELFDRLCEHIGGLADAIHGKWYFAKLLDDEKTVWRNPLKHTKNDIFGIIVGYNRINLQATLVYSDGFEETLAASTSARVVLDVNYGQGYQCYTSNVSLIGSDFLNTLMRKALIDEILEDL